MRRFARFLTSCLSVGVCALAILAVGRNIPARSNNADTDHSSQVASPTGLVPVVAQTLARHLSGVWLAKRTADGVYCTNPTQHLVIRMDTKGLHLTTQMNGSIGLQLVGYMQGNKHVVLHPAIFSIRGTRVTRADGSGLTEWYVNSPLGIEQGFTLAKPLHMVPRLSLSFRVNGKFAPSIKNGTLLFRNPAGQPVLQYGDLLAFDAYHRPLRAYMSLIHDYLSLTIETEGARYPVTVDPLFTVVTQIPDPAAAAGDAFGYSMAISSDDNTALVSATRAYNSNGYGVAYVFAANNGVWSASPVATFADPGAYHFDAFGTSVALSSDGRTALISAPGENGYTGAVYVYTAANGVWSTSPVATFTDPAGVNNDYGESVSLSGNGVIALVGAPATANGGPKSNYGAAYLYAATNGAWSNVPVASFANPAATDDGFGFSVALPEDGDLALIGSYYRFYTGPAPVYLFSASNGIWDVNPVPIATMNEPGPTSNDQFGASVALSGNGTAALVGAGSASINGQATGAAYVFSTNSSSWPPNPVPVATLSVPLTDEFGISVALSNDGDTALIGAPLTTVGSTTYVGAAYVFTSSGGVWGGSPTVVITDPQAMQGDQFGASTALSGDGTNALIGADLGINQNSLVYAITSSVDLSLSLASEPIAADVDQDVTYLATVTNNDIQVTATGLSLTDVLAVGTTFVSASAAGGTCNNNNDTITCTLTNLGPRATWQPSITVVAATNGLIQNTASVNGNQPDPNSANNTAIVNTVIGLPTASGGTMSTQVGQAINGTLAGSNPCKCGTPAFTIVAMPSHGTVLLTNTTTGAFSYTPASAFVGTDSFSFQFGNGLVSSNDATESVTVDDIPPISYNGSITSMSGQAINGTLSAKAAYNGQTLTYQIVIQPAHGTVTVNDASSAAFTYTPTVGYSGTDSFAFNVKDQVGTLSNTATESITVQAAPTPPSQPPKGGSSSGSGGGGGIGLLSLEMLALLWVLRAQKKRWR